MKKYLKNPLFIFIITLLISWSVFITNSIYESKSTEAQFYSYKIDNQKRNDEIINSIKELNKSINESYNTLNKKIDDNNKLMNNKLDECRNQTYDILLKIGGK